MEGAFVMLSMTDIGYKKKTINVKAENSVYWNDINCKCTQEAV